MSIVRPRRLAVLGLLALVPVALFALGRPAPVAWLSAVCVLVIAAVLHVMFREAATAAATA